MKIDKASRGRLSFDTLDQVNAFVSAEVEAKRLWYAYVRHVTGCEGFVHKDVDPATVTFEAVSPTNRKMILPAHPDAAYAHSGWAGWQDWISSNEPTIKAEALANASKAPRAKRERR